MTIEIVVPQVGEAVSEVVLVEWFKKEGDSLKKGEPLFEVDTDKAMVEVEAFADGTLVRILVPDNSPVMPQQVVGLLAPAGETASPEPSQTEQTAGQVEVKNKVSPVAQRVATELRVDLNDITASDQRIKVEDVRRFAAQQAKETDSTGANRSAGRILATPKARRLAKALGVELAGLTGTGVDGLVTSGDVQAAASSPATISPTEITPTTPATPAEAAPSLPVSGDGASERLPFSKLRQTIAARTQASKQTVPHFYLMADVELTQVQQLRSYCTQTAGWECSPTYTDIVVRACALALAALPSVNVYFTAEGPVRRRAVDIGVAVSVEDGLIVPVLPQANRLNLQETSAQIRGLVERARQGRLREADLAQKSMVVSNLGMYGVDAFVAIIDLPDPMILAVGQVADRPMAVNGQLAIRPMCTLTLSADHRVLDGVQGAQFLMRVKEILENPFEIMGDR